MADLKISALPRKSALASNDLIPIVDLQFGTQNYVNKKTTIGDIVATVGGAVTELIGAISSVNGQTGDVVIGVSNLGDTIIATPETGDILRYDSAANKWVNIPFIVAGKISADYLPSYVDDVVEYSTLAEFPSNGESGKIYVAIDTRLIYRWSGSIYVEIGNVSAADWASITNKPNTFTPPVATSETLGGVKIGSGIFVNVDGIISVNTNYAATNHTHGSLTNDGKIGTAPNRIIYTTADGLLAARNPDDNTAAIINLHNLGRVSFRETVAADLGLVIDHDSVTFSDSTVQTTAWTGVINWSGVQDLPGAIAEVAAIDDLAAYIDERKVTSTAFTVKGVEQGIYNDNTEIPQGTPLETIIKNMLQKVIPPVYRQPILTLNTSPAAQVYEIGTNLTALLSITWDKRDAGDATAFRFLKNNVVIHGITGSSLNPVTFLHSDSFILTSATTFTAQVDHAQGPQLLDNMENPSGVPIAARNNLNSGSRVFTPRFKIFYGVSASEALDSAGILTLSSELSTTLNQSRTFTAANAFIYFAWPASYGNGSFTVGGLPNSAWIKTTVSFTNSVNYTSDYFVYRSQFRQNGSNIAVVATQVS